MAGQQQKYSSRYPSLLVTVKHKVEDRSIADTYSSPRIRRSKDNFHPSTFQSKSVYYNCNHQYSSQQFFTRPSPTTPRRQPLNHYGSYDRIHYHYQQQQQQQSIRPLMDIKDNVLTLHQELDREDEETDDTDLTYRSLKQKEPKQRGQYRNRKAELDWDHAFDLDLVDLYATNGDADRHSLTSTISSSDNSFSSM